MFSYLLFFRTTTYFGIPNPPGHTNLIQMVLTLKVRIHTLCVCVFRSKQTDRNYNCNGRYYYLNQESIFSWWDWPLNGMRQPKS